MRQDIAGYSIDVPTRAEMQQDLKESLGHSLSGQVREMYRGVKALKFPYVSARAGGTSLNLGSQPPTQQLGPEQGYFWVIGRVTVVSTGTDTGAVSLYASSDTSNYNAVALVDNALKVGQAYYPGKRGLLLWPGEQLYVAITSVATNSYTLTGIAVEVPGEMVGKLLL